MTQLSGTFSSSADAAPHLAWLRHRDSTVRIISSLHILEWCS
jgi:hypothetical protein